MNTRVNLKSQVAAVLLYFTFCATYVWYAKVNTHTQSFIFTAVTIIIVVIVFYLPERYTYRRA